ncbi:MAG: PilZ domain-containing protein [Pseudomonadales bacterium]
MERREHPRIQLPLLVELQHPSTGRRNCVARDVSEGGVFVQIADVPLKTGAKIKLTVRNANTVDTQPTPTVDMEVVRIEDEGLGCRFVNRTSRHLWESVQRLRAELAVGQDYFQLHVCAACLNEMGRLLIVQQNGRWTFPGAYLKVGDDWRERLSQMLSQRFSLVVKPAEIRLLTLETEANADIPEAAVAKLFTVVRTDASGFAFKPGERYKASRWLQNPRMVDELTFTDDLTRRLAGDAFRWLRDQEANG